MNNLLMIEDNISVGIKGHFQYCDVIIKII